MTSEEYIKLAKNTDVPDYKLVASRAFHALLDPKTGPTMHAMFGIGSESGEFIDAFKKWLFYGKEPDFVNLDEEIGDLLWYIGIYLECREKPFEEIFQQNIAKLRARYPNKFTEHDALNRDLDKERAVLEGAVMCPMCQRRNTVKIDRPEVYEFNYNCLDCKQGFN